MSLENTQWVEENSTKIEYADVNETPEKNMDNLLNNILNTTKTVEKNNYKHTTEYKKCLLECKDAWEHNENYTQWLVNIFDSYLKQEA